MHIERIQVDEGFLDGLDLRLQPGLNVLIGARGSGKTSLIELIRFCLDAPAFTDEAAERGHQQALSVLQGGQVTVTLTDGEQRVTIVRSASDESPRSTDVTPEVTILGQGEIEAVGAQPSGRLHLIDRLRPERRDLEIQSDQLRSEIRSITTEVRDLFLEVDDMQLAIESSKDVPEKLELALKAEEVALASVQATAEERGQLESLQTQSAQLKVRRGVYDRALAELRSLDVDLGRIASRSLLAETWPKSAGEEDLLDPIRTSVVGSLSQTAKIRRSVAEAVDAIERHLQNDVATGVTIDNTWRELRHRLDQVEEGVGAITRRVEELREQAGQIAALSQRLEEKGAQADQQVKQRDELYRALDEIRQERFSSRLSIAQSVTEELGPDILVEAIRSEETRAYSEAIIAGLRGSGLHYNTRGPQLAGSMSPLELIHAVEARDPQPIADATEMTLQQASSIVQALKGSDLASIVAASIDDGITLQLLDGSVFKKSQDVSIGQRCTIVLPVLLTRHGGILVVDQPEDQIDNSFITSTVVTALRQRHPEDQLFLASHNANIPVLAEADLIVALDSDGKRGWVKHTGPLDNASSVTAITTVMEGGLEAFRRRADFYRAAQAEG